jgi:uncharacterized protein YbgA (DUF1722 family)
VNKAAPAEEEPIRLGVSSCLLGETVRFDGGHKRDRFVTDLLGSFVEWVPVCPELEVGMGVPRPAMRLVRETEVLRLVEIQSGRDHTRNMKRYAARRVRALRDLDLCGYVLKKDSPSCGMARVKVYGEKGMPKREGRGLFAYRRLRQLLRGRWTNAQVVAFHTTNKLQLMAHSPDALRALGRWVASVKRTPRAGFRERYERGFMETLAKLATRGSNANVLQHAAGYLKKRLDPISRAELADLIHEYRRGLVPLVVPMTLLRHHARRHEIDYLKGQAYLEPHPKELMLRNHV